MNRTRGITLIELLVSMAILGILMLAFTQVFGSSLRASSEINARNELISEAQIAQQLIVSRLQNAYYVYPNGTSITLTTGGVTTLKTPGIGTGQNWTVGTDPIVAMILPPKKSGYQCSSANDNTKDACFTFYAYYPYNRGSFVNAADRDIASSEKPNPDPLNDDQWLLMEYKARLYDSVDRTTNILASPPNTATTLTNSASVTPNIKGNAGSILVDFIQPTTAIPSYALFSVGTTSVDINLRLLQQRGGKALRVPIGNAPFARPTPTLSTRVYPRNWY